MSYTAMLPDDECKCGVLLHTWPRPAGPANRERGRRTLSSSDVCIFWKSQQVRATSTCMRIRSARVQVWCNAQIQLASASQAQGCVATRRSGLVQSAVCVMPDCVATTVVRRYAAWTGRPRSMTVRTFSPGHAVIEPPENQLLSEAAVGPNALRASCDNCTSKKDVMPGLVRRVVQPCHRVGACSAHALTVPWPSDDI